jgi:hypothetical protein
MACLPGCGCETVENSVRQSRLKSRWANIPAIGCAWPSASP